jgi:hypothetical protein
MVSRDVVYRGLKYFYKGKIMSFLFLLSLIDGKQSSWFHGLLAYAKLELPETTLNQWLPVLLYYALY